VTTSVALSVRFVRCIREIKLGLQLAESGGTYGRSIFEESALGPVMVVESGKYPICVTQSAAVFKSEGRDSICVSILLSLKGFCRLLNKDI
jgi:hypothetical protein